MPDPPASSTEGGADVARPDDDVAPPGAEEAMPDEKIGASKVFPDPIDGLGCPNLITSVSNRCNLQKAKEEEMVEKAPNQGGGGRRCLHVDLDGGGMKWREDPENCDSGSFIICEGPELTTNRVPPAMEMPGDVGTSEEPREDFELWGRNPSAGGGAPDGEPSGVQVVLTGPLNATSASAERNHTASCGGPELMANHMLPAVEAETAGAVGTHPSTSEEPAESFETAAGREPGGEPLDAHLTIGIPPATSAAAEGNYAGRFPSPSLRAYLEKVFARHEDKDPAVQAASQKIMKDMILKANKDGTLYTKDWASEPLFPMPSVSYDVTTVDPPGGVTGGDLSEAGSGTQCSPPEAVGMTGGSLIEPSSVTCGDPDIGSITGGRMLEAGSATGGGPLEASGMTGGVIGGDVTGGSVREAGSVTGGSPREAGGVTEGRVKGGDAAVASSAICDDPAGTGGAPPDSGGVTGGGLVETGSMTGGGPLGARGVTDGEIGGDATGRDVTGGSLREAGIATGGTPPEAGNTEGGSRSEAGAVPGGSTSGGDATGGDVTSGSIAGGDETGGRVTSDSISGGGGTGRNVTGGSTSDGDGTGGSLPEASAVTCGSVTSGSSSAGDGTGGSLLEAGTVTGGCVTSGSTSGDDGTGGSALEALCVTGGSTPGGDGAGGSVSGGSEPDGRVTCGSELDGSVPAGSATEAVARVSKRQQKKKSRRDALPTAEPDQANGRRAESQKRKEHPEWDKEEAAEVSRSGDVRLPPSSAQEEEEAKVDKDTSAFVLQGVLLRMEVCRKEGNTAFKTGDMQTAIDQFTTGILTGDLTDAPAWSDLRAVLLSNRSAAHAFLGEWRESLDDAVRAVSLRPDTVKAWARVITALCHLRMPTLGHEMLRESKERLDNEKFEEVEKAVSATLAAARDGGVNAFLAAMRADSNDEWLCIRAGTTLLQSANASGKIKSVRGFRTSGGVAILTRMLNELEWEDLHCEMTATAVADAYSALADTCFQFGREATSLLIEGTGIHTRSYQACERNIEKVCASTNHLKVHCAQLLFMVNVRDYLPKHVVPTRAMLERVREWAETASSFRTIFLSGREVPIVCFMAMIRTLAYFHHRSAVTGMEEKKASMMAGLLEAMTSWHAMKWEREKTIMPGYTAHIVFETARSFIREKGRLDQILAVWGGPITGEVRLRALIRDWTEHHTNMNVGNKAKRFISALPATYRGPPSKEVARALARRFCRGSCEPTKQEKHRGDFVLHHHWEGVWRRHFCSGACFDEQMLAVPSARLLLHVAQTRWNEGIADLQKAETDSAIRGLNSCLAALLAEPRLPGITDGIPFVRSGLAHVFDMTHSRAWDFLETSINIRSREEGLEDKLAHPSWHCHVDASLAKDPLKRLEALRADPGRDSMWHNSLADIIGYGTTAATSSAVNIDTAQRWNLHVWELRAWTLLYTVRDESVLAHHAVEMLQSWEDTSLTYCRPRLWIVRGLLFALLTLLPDTSECGECVETGRQRWVQAWARVDGSADSEELGLHLVLTWLARDVNDNGMLKAAAAAERKAQQLWGEEEVAKQWERLPPCLRRVLERSPPDQSAPHTKFTNCSLCGKAKQSARSGEPKVQIKFCGGCQSTAYCSRECQKVDWKQAHKAVCRHLPPSRESDGRDETIEEPTQSTIEANNADSERRPSPHYHDSIKETTTTL